jgi:hypothetical protein
METTVNITIPRVFSPSTNPTGWIAAAGAILAASVMITNAVNNHGIIDTSVIISAVGAVMALFARQVVTPVADPKNAIGVPLVPVTEKVLTYAAPAPVVQVTPNPTGGTVGQV